MTHYLKLTLRDQRDGLDVGSDITLDFDVAKEPTKDTLWTWYLIAKERMEKQKADLIARSNTQP